MAVAEQYQRDARQTIPPGLRQEPPGVEPAENVKSMELLKIAIKRLWIFTGVNSSYIFQDYKYTTRVPPLIFVSTTWFQTQLHRTLSSLLGQTKATIAQVKFCFGLYWFSRN
jgi:hypothetical protein